MCVRTCGVVWSRGLRHCIERGQLSCHQSVWPIPPSRARYFTFTVQIGIQFAAGIDDPQMTFSSWFCWLCDLFSIRWKWPFVPRDYISQSDIDTCRYLWHLQITLMLPRRWALIILMNPWPFKKNFLFFRVCTTEDGFLCMRWYTK